MQDLRNANITMEAMDSEFNSSKTQVKQKDSHFDEKNYLNVRLEGDQTTKEVKIRLLPINGNSQTPFKKIHVHTIKVPKEVSASGWKSYICLEKTDGFDVERYGKKCPFCELNREAYKNFTEATDDIEKKRWKDISLSNAAKEACIVRCIERGAEEDGPKFWKFNIRKDNTDPKGQIMELYKTRLDESRDEGLDDENILDIRTGKDLKVTISLAAENRTAVKVVDYGKNKPLSTDETAMMSWVNDGKEWFDVFSLKPYDYLKVILDGEVPFYDKRFNKWVTKVEYKNDAEVERTNMENAIADAEKMVLNGAVPTDLEKNPVIQGTSEELPF